MNGATAQSLPREEKCFLMIDTQQNSLPNNLSLVSPNQPKHLRWSEVLDPKITDLGHRLSAKDLDERRHGHIIYPPHEKIFRALNTTPPDKVKVVIIGQDPYINEGQAEGLCFSVAPDCPFPPSLENIFTELNSDLGISRPESGSLISWAEQGVLLLNTSLTVEAGHPASHSNWGWDGFTRGILETAVELPQPIVFIAWGSHAKNIARPLNISSHPNKAIIESAHPSPLSAYRGFFGSKPFSRTNALLQQMGATPIDWKL